LDAAPAPMISPAGGVVKMAYPGYAKI